MDSELKNFLLPLARQHIAADRWKDTAGTDFWFMPSLLQATATAGLNSVTAAGGWTMEAEHAVAGSGGDFLGGTLTAGVPAVPGIPTHIALLATGDLIVSPPIFGGYDHAMAASAIVHKKTRPNRLIMDVRAAFTTTADEETSGFGFFEDATTTTSATDTLQLAFISPNATTFQLSTNGDAAGGDTGAVITNTWHDWRIELLYDTAGVIRANWYIDRALQGYVVPTQAEAPYAFGAHTLTTSVLKIGPVHIFYDW